MHQPGEPFTLTLTQINILHHLKRRGGWDTMVSLRRLFNDCNRHVGPHYVEKAEQYAAYFTHPSLITLGYVGIRHEEQEGEKGGRAFVAYLTPEGEAAAERFKTRKADQRYRIPRDMLDAAAIPIRPTRTYSFESYTTEDLDQVRDLLDEKYRDIEDESLKHQLANRRKAGAFADDDLDGKWPDWYRHYRSLQTWRDTADEAMTRASERCGINWDHDGRDTRHGSGRLDVYHRVFFRHGDCILGREEPRDLIVLCQMCRRKVRNALPPPPGDRPTW